MATASRCFAVCGSLFDEPRRQAWAVVEEGPMHLTWLLASEVTKLIHW
jgi:hypothetical protein